MFRTMNLLERICAIFLVFVSSPKLFLHSLCDLVGCHKDNGKGNQGSERSVCIWRGYGDWAYMAQAPAIMILVSSKWNAIYTSSHLSNLFIVGMKSNKKGGETQRNALLGYRIASARDSSYRIDIDKVTPWISIICILNLSKVRSGGWWCGGPSPLLLLLSTQS